MLKYIICMVQIVCTSDYFCLLDSGKDMLNFPDIIFQFFDCTGSSWLHSLSLVAVCGLLIVRASLFAERRLSSFPGPYRILPD